MYMSNLKLSYKIILANIGLAFIFFIFYGITGGYSSGAGFRDAPFIFGIVCLAMGLVNLFIGLIFLFSKSVEWRNGFLLSGASLLILSGLACGGGAAFG